MTPNLRGDGVSYYAFLASALGDGDLQFEDEYRHSDPVQCRLFFDEDGKPLEKLRTSTEHLRNFYSVGPAVFWSPFYALAHVGVRIHNAIVPADRAVATDGYSRPYLTLVAIGSAVLGFLGLCTAFAVAHRLSGKGAALGAVLGIWLASNLPVYMYLLPYMSHASSAFINSVFVWYWWRTWREPTPEAPLPRSTGQWALLGFFAGWVVTTYALGGLLWLFIAADGLVLLWAWQRDGAAVSLRAAWIASAALPLAFGIAVGLLPQLLVRWTLYGSIFFRDAYSALPWHWTAPNTFQVLFSSHHGLWTWTPVLLLACIGLIPLARRHPALGWRAALCFLGCVYLMGSKTSWHGGSAFGSRYFLILTPLFVLGLAEFLRAAGSWLDARRPGLARPALSTTIALLVLWNAGFIFQWAANVVPNRGPIDFGEMARNQVTVVPMMLVRNAGPILFERQQFVERIEAEDLNETQNLALRPGVCR